MRQLMPVVVLMISLVLTSVPACALMLGKGGVLAPGQFRGSIRQAYQAAQDNIDLASKLFCYCGCDQGDGHRSLLDCYRNSHAVYCNICRAEMLRAVQYAKQGLPLATISKRIDQEFAKEYPFKDGSPALNRYRRGQIPAVSSQHHDRSTE